MLVFIDESGDPGIRKGSYYLVLAMVKFNSTADAQSVDEAIENLRNAGHHRREFKFSQLNHKTRDDFFNTVMPRKFDVKVVIWDMHMHTPSSLKSPEIAYQMALSRLLQLGQLNKARIRLDARAGRNVRRYLKSQKDYFNAEQPGTVLKIGMRDSNSDNLVQLADMVAGAVARSLDPKKKNRHRWRRRLDLKRGDILTLP